MPIFQSASAIAKRMRRYARSTKVEVDISFESDVQNRNQETVSRSTFDVIAGKVSIKTDQDTRFDTVTIKFVGEAHTVVDSMSGVIASPGSNRIQGYQRLVELQQPNLAQHLPADNILRARKRYELDFHFVVPKQRPVHACAHPIENLELRAMHLTLPPSLGDPCIADGRDDFAPMMSKISYKICAQVVHHDTSTVIAESERPVRIAPAVEETRGLDDEEDDEICLRREKTFRKHGLVGGKVGSLVAEIGDPPRFTLPSLGEGTGDDAVSSLATIFLRYDTNEGGEPPRLASLSAKFHAITFFSCIAARAVPRRRLTPTDGARGVFSEAVHLSTRSMQAVEWERHNGSIAHDDTVPPTGCSSISGSSLIPPEFPAPSQRYQPSNSFYTAIIVVPLTLPKSKRFVPTFHNCLVSRTYTLALVLKIATGHGSTAIELKCPARITSEVNQVNLMRQAMIAGQVGVPLDEYLASDPRLPEAGADARPPPGYAVHAPAPQVALAKLA